METMSGLTTAEVQERIARGQVNISQDNISKSTLDIVKEHTLTYFNFLNLFLGLIVILSGKFLNLTFLGVVTVNTIIGIIQELRVKKVIDQMSIITTTHATVIREGESIDIPVDEIVLDDIIYVKAGDQISADAKVFVSDFLEVNEAMLTGESLPVKKKEGSELMSGSFVVAGNGYARVTHVGSDNYASQLVRKAKKGHRAASEMKDMIEKIIKVISIVIIPVGIVLFRAQHAVQPDWSTAVVKTVGGVVGMIPEGLVLLTSLSFVLGVGRLARKKALVQQMEAIEALSRVDVLCLDKTGTITTGDLTVKYVVPLVDEGEAGVNVFVKQLLHAIKEDNPTSQALRTYFGEDDSHQVIDYIPFSSARKYQAAAFDDGTKIVLGAPECLLAQDDPVLSDMEDYIQLGYRVLLIGTCSAIGEKECQNIESKGLIIISDVIKDDARETFAFFKQEGVSLRILSGDNPVTVSRVCLQAGLEEGSQYIDASTLPDTVEEISAIIDDYHVIGRVKPEQKQLIIKAFQANGHVVGMVGDGVNDVLAIKDADCGIAMANGADAAKQAAHIVLTDSRFSSMKSIVKEGRIIIANIERVSSLYLTKTIYSSALSLIFGLAAMSYPFTPFQLSLIGSLMIGAPSFFITLCHDASLDQRGFLSHVLSTAAPCALTIIAYIVAFAMGYQLHIIDEMHYITFAYLLTASISYVVVYLVFTPLTLLKSLVFAGLGLTFMGVVTAVPSLLAILPATAPGVVWIYPLIMSSLCVLPVMGIFTKWLDQRYNRS